MKQDNVNGLMTVVSPEEFLELFSPDELFTMGKEMGLIDDDASFTDLKSPVSAHYATKLKTDYEAFQSSNLKLRSSRQVQEALAA